jgi:hypothetical protein
MPRRPPHLSQVLSTSPPRCGQPSTCAQQLGTAARVSVIRGTAVNWDRAWSQSGLSCHSYHCQQRWGTRLHRVSRATDVLPEAPILQCSTVAGSIEGDPPSERVSHRECRNHRGRADTVRGAGHRDRSRGQRIPRRSHGTGPYTSADSAGPILVSVNGAARLLAGAPPQPPGK